MSLPLTWMSVREWYQDGKEEIMMLQFTNGFSCAMDQQKEELMINFIQQIPEIGDDGKTENVRIEEVINLVMGKVMAQNLLEALSGILSEDDTEK